MGEWDVDGEVELVGNDIRGPDEALAMLSPKGTLTVDGSG